VSTIAEQLADLYARLGHECYGEGVTLLEHSLLTAQAAERAGASDHLVVACLLHDIGHLLEESDDAYGVHDHGDVSGDYLARYFPASVSEPARLHVAAKRYLCATDAEYTAVLSEASRYTLEKQGGPMSSAERREFEANPYHREGVRLRRWEDMAGKQRGTRSPDWSHFHPLLERLAGSQESSDRTSSTSRSRRGATTADSTG